jgi:hypothetical protein
MPVVIVLKVFSLEGLIYTPGQRVDPWAWLRLTDRERNTMINTGKVRLEASG